MFFLAYHLHWQHDDVLELSTDDRWAYIRLLSAQLQKEHDATNQMRRK